MAEPADNVSPITDLSRNLTTLCPLSGSPWKSTPQMPSLKLMPASTPDSGQSFRLKILTPSSAEGSSAEESETEPSPLLPLHRRVVMAQVNRTVVGGTQDSPLFISRVCPTRRGGPGGGSLTKRSNAAACSPLRKNSSQGYCSASSDGFAVDEVIPYEDNKENDRSRHRRAGGTASSLIMSPMPAVNSKDNIKKVHSARRNLSFCGGGLGDRHPCETPVKSKRCSDELSAEPKRSKVRLAERRDTNVPEPKPTSEKRLCDEAAGVDREAAEDVIDGGRIETLPTSEPHKRCALPTISVTTLHDIIVGKFDHVVRSFEIIDCRWPYEFEGGHIRGAKNLYTQELVYQEFLEKRASKKDNYKDEDNSKDDDDNNSNNSKDDTTPEPTPKKKDIIIFHCEFSSERGPKLSQFLREKDRESNVYPKLYYPEVYILKGGYKEFFDSFREYCDPQEYLKMQDIRFVEECRIYRAQTKHSEKKNVPRKQSSRF